MNCDRQSAFSEPNPAVDFPALEKIVCEHEVQIVKETKPQSVLLSNGQSVSAVPRERKNRFTVDVLKLTSGTVVAQIISVCAAPLIARLFAPQAFGIAALFTSISGVLAIVVCLRYDRSIIVPASDEEAFNLVGVSLLCVVLITALSVMIVTLGRPLLLERLNAPGLGPYLWMVPVNVFLLGLLAALNSWHTRKRNFSLVTIAQVLSAVSYLFFAIAAGVTRHASGGALIVGAIIGQVIAALLLAVETWRECWPGLIRRINTRQLTEVLYRYHKFPKYSTGAAVLNSLSWEMPSFFLSGFFSTMVVGQYALGNRLIRIPMSLIGLNISRVFSQRAAAARHEGTLGSLVERTFESLVTLGMLPFLLLTLVGKELFVLVFGARWAEAGVYTEILSLWAFFWFASAPLGSVLDVLEEQALDLRINALILGTRFISLLVGGYSGSPRLTLAFFSASGVLVYGYYCLAILGKCGLPYSRPLRILLKHAVTFLPYCAIVLAAKLFGAPPLTVLLLSTILFFVYYLGVIHTTPELRELITVLVLNRFQQPASETPND